MQITESFYSFQFNINNFLIDLNCFGNHFDKAAIYSTPKCIHDIYFY